VVKANADFLKKSDLIYGISGGKFLEKIIKDESLKELDDIEACLKIYKRVLLPIKDQIKANKKLRNRLSKHCDINAAKITDYGGISVREAKKELLRIPKKERLSFAVDRYNSILSQVYDVILTDTSAGAEDILRKLRLVLTLNKDKAMEIGVDPTLLGKLATTIPQMHIYRLYSSSLEELVEERTRELKVAQENLLKSQRLAVIGEVAAMVGHDLRNPLQAIMYTLYLAEKKLESSSGRGLKEMLDTIKEQVDYANKIVSDLQDYSRPLKPTLVETSLRQLVHDTLSTIMVPKNVKVSIRIEENLPNLMVDSSFIRRVFINLITNALQAMPDGGLLTIKASKSGDSVLISFQDTGIGISPENLTKIFQPLFTTKAKGQGLGLAVCRRLVEAHNGNITVQSEAGKGSTFTIEIPLKPQNPLIKVF